MSAHSIAQRTTFVFRLDCRDAPYREFLHEDVRRLEHQRPDERRAFRGAKQRDRSPVAVSEQYRIADSQHLEQGRQRLAPLVVHVRRNARAAQRRRKPVSVARIYQRAASGAPRQRRRKIAPECGRAESLVQKHQGREPIARRGNARVFQLVPHNDHAIHGRSFQIGNAACFARLNLSPLRERSNVEAAQTGAQNIRLVQRSLALVLLAMTMPPSPVPSAFVSPAAIFERSIRRLASYPLAPYVVWTSTWQFSESVPGASNQAYNVTLRYAMRTSDKMETYSNYPIGTFLPNASVVVSWNGPFAWELRPKTAAQRDARVPDMPSELKTIATVVVSHPDYAIDLAGIDQIDGHRAYHLRLRPLADAVRHNLRELWVERRQLRPLESGLRRDPAGWRPDRKLRRRSTRF